MIPCDLCGYSGSNPYHGHNGEEIAQLLAKKTIPALGGVGILIEADLVNLAEGTKRVARLMADGQKHTREEIAAAAKQAEGTRRLRELREVRGVVVRCERAPGTRQFVYWLERAGPGEAALTI